MEWRSWPGSCGLGCRGRIPDDRRGDLERWCNLRRPDSGLFGRRIGGCSDGIQLAIGAPGDDIGSTKPDAGTVVIVPPPGLPAFGPWTREARSPAARRQMIASGPPWRSGGTTTTLPD